MFSLWDSLSYLSYREISGALFVYCLVLVGLLIVRALIIKRVATVAKTTQTDWDDAVISAIKRIGWPVYLVVPLYIASNTIILPLGVSQFISWGTLIVIAVYGALSVEKLLTKILTTILRRRARAHGEEADRTVIHFSSLALRMVMWAMVLLLILQNLGYEVTALLGGLGIVGITLGFALQNVLEDVFSFFSIYFDKPFEVGDFIEVGNNTGTVKKIGIKTTRIQSLRGEEIVLSNKQLTETALNNYKKMAERRVEFTLDIDYDTALNKVKKVAQIVEDICNSIDEIEFTRVTLSDLADSSIQFEVVYNVKDSDYLLHKSVREQINIKILEAFKKANISLAYPTQKILLEK